MIVTVDDVKRIFEAKIDKGMLKLPDGSFIDVTGFATIFASAPSDPTYDDLMIIDGYVDDENPGKGYKPFFDQCRNDGLFN